MEMATEQRKIMTNEHRLRDFLQSSLFIFAKRFVAGQTLKEALEVVKNLNAKGFFTTLDFLGESVASVEEATIATEQNILLLRALRERQLDLNISVKPTQLGLLIDRKLFEHNLKKIAQTAKDLGAFVRVDIEGSSTTDATFEIILQLKSEGFPVGAAVQAMLKRSPHDVVRFIEDGIRLRLCKGAYKEPPVLALRKKNDIRRQYLALAKRLLTSRLYHGFATHDEALIEAIKAFVVNNDISRNAFEFQMLYGMRSDLQEKLKREGWRVRIYVPFGYAWLPYFYRRLRERKENVWFVLKNLFRS